MSLFDGSPLVHNSLTRVIEVGFSPTIVVLGYREKEIREAIIDCHVEIVSNPNYADGMASSLKAAISVLPHGIDGALIYLADMPLVQTTHLALMRKTFATAALGSVVRATSHGKPGNGPVASSIRGQKFPGCGLVFMLC